MPDNLKPLEELRGQFTVFSHLDHGLNGGHSATHGLLSGVRASEAAGMPGGNISLDQFCAEHVAGQTRFPLVEQGRRLAPWENASVGNPTSDVLLSRGERTGNNHFTRDVLRADGTRAHAGYGVDSLTFGLVAVCRVKFAGETRAAAASLRAASGLPRRGLTG